MNIKFTKIKPYLYHAQFDTKYDMTSTMLRMAEYYESPEFKGKAFTLAQFKKWYMKSTDRKRFTYYEDWSGYNIPSKELKPFYAGKFDPLSQKEQNILSLLQDIKGKYYLIATCRREKLEQDTVNHETTHAIYCFEKEYSSKVKNYLKGKDTQEITALLIKKGYSGKTKIMIDEINAYLTNDMAWLRKKGLKQKQYDKYSQDLIEIRKPYWK